MKITTDKLWNILGFSLFVLLIVFCALYIDEYSREDEVVPLPEYQAYEILVKQIYQLQMKVREMQLGEFDRRKEMEKVYKDLADLRNERDACLQSLLSANPGLAADYILTDSTRVARRGIGSELRR